MLLKVFVTIGLSSMFMKWLSIYLNLPDMRGTPIESVLLWAFIAFVAFMIGFAFGLIYGEENASSRYENMWHRFYKNS